MILLQCAADSPSALLLIGEKGSSCLSGRLRIHTKQHEKAKAGAHGSACARERQRRKKARTVKACPAAQHSARTAIRKPLAIFEE